MKNTKDRILDVAIEVLGMNPDAGMGEIAMAVGVVRRTVYGYFPSRAELIMALTQRAVSEIERVLNEDTDGATAADVAWASFILHLWPLAHRYRVLVALRRGEYGRDIHTLLVPVEESLAGLIERGQDAGVFGRHLPADVLSQVAWSSVFAIADSDSTRGDVGGSGALMTSLLMLGVPESRANALVEQQ